MSRALWVEENSDQLLELVLHKDLSVRVTGLELYVKPAPDSTDGAPLYSLGNGLAILAAPIGHISIQFRRSDLQQPGGRFYRLDAIKAGRRVTLASGRLAVNNV